MAEPKVRSRVPWLKLLLVPLVLAFTLKDAAINLFAPRPPNREQRRQAALQDTVRLRQVHLWQLKLDGDRCRPVVAREIARTLAFDGQSVDAFADDYARRCGEDDVIRKWASLHRGNELRKARAPVVPVRAEAPLQ